MFDPSNLPPSRYGPVQRRSLQYPQPGDVWVDSVLAPTRQIVVCKFFKTKIGFATNLNVCGYVCEVSRKPLDANRKLQTLVGGGYIEMPYATFKDQFTSLVCSYDEPMFTRTRHRSYPTRAKQIHWTVNPKYPNIDSGIYNVDDDELRFILENRESAPRNYTHDDK